MLNKYIDHTYLKADATKEIITKLCLEAKEYDFMSVCVNPKWISYCKELLKDSNVLVCTVIGFPLGSNTTEVKAFETRDAIQKGADEIDMVINIGALKDNEYSYLLNDIAAVVAAAEGKTVKVIIEACLLSQEEKITACKACLEAGADFVKTSTGFSTGGATIDDVLLMKSMVKDQAKIKAAGGVRSYDDFEKMIEAGADRIGTSSGVSLMQKKEVNTDY